MHKPLLHNKLYITEQACQLKLRALLGVLSDALTKLLPPKSGSSLVKGFLLKAFSLLSTLLRALSLI
ncbi:MAG: hypothetical protein A3G17_04925 [Planctomycetes bacterium RIFCSPLOWO2_12_FULL_50_35]|nr:MAG: hypothetical protein A3G17_04925 [Planctomycetes bacterium RIFCSPLOWO2_12_FULL_50_35]HCN19247.1 hypothetical protein [Planctomycetia bacterium]